MSPHYNPAVLLQDAPMLVATWVIAISGIIAALAAVRSAALVRKGIEDQTKNFEKQSTAYRLSLSVDVAFRLDSKFDDEKFKKLRSLAAGALLHHKDEEDAEY